MCLRRLKMLKLILFTIVVHNIVASTLLDDYVFDESDRTYLSYQVIDVAIYPKFKTYKLNITTLKWLNESFVDRSVWWHYLYINVPNHLKLSFTRKKAILYVDWGDNSSDNVTFNNYVSEISVKFNCISATLGQVPNMPIRFENDIKRSPKIENELVSWTWNMFIQMFYDKNIPRRMINSVPVIAPMTKAIIRTMDIIQEFAVDYGYVVPENFILCGISKRAWPVWLASSLDNKRSLHNQYRSYGGAYSFEFQEFHQVEIDSYIDGRQYNALLKLIDPIYYLNRLNKTKILIITSTGDEYMMPENVGNFWKQLNHITESNCYLRRIPNDDHFLTNHYEDTVKNTAYFANFVMHTVLFKLPKINWNFVNNSTHASIELVVSDLLWSFNTIELVAFEAHTLGNRSRDFRLLKYDPVTKNITTQTIIWKSKTIVPRQSIGFRNRFKYTFSIERENEDKYWTGFFIQIGLTLRLDFSQTKIIYFSTETNIVPERYPVNDCQFTKCWGPLV